ncbi:hypothetical protein PoB_002693200 [Plakobranchus ocellatus]|uniref:Uncharacterized protein n=1 Tax=Plakobranchus ocellatus TaxID=259542 RepID=A0AAV3ZZG2_9GAST|nr:hypothetical protein PoB_002693200 [Plakobranchus ocellatus]
MVDFRSGIAWFVCKARPQQGDLRLSDPPSDQGASERAQTQHREVPEILVYVSLSTGPPTPPLEQAQNVMFSHKTFYSGNNTICHRSIGKPLFATAMKECHYLPSQ